MPGIIKVVIVGYAATIFDRKSFEIEASPGMKLRDLFITLSKSAGTGFREAVYDKSADRMNEYLTAFINSREARSLSGLDTVLKAGDVVTIMPPMAGGTD